MGFDPRYFKIGRDGRTATAKDAASAAGGRVVKRQPTMNGLERAYSQHLDELVRAGRVARWWAKPFNIRLGGNQYYRPDFAAERPSGAGGRLVVVETKGHLEDDAREKFLHAIALWPCWDFLMVKKDGAGWAVMMRSEGAGDL